MSVLRKGSKPWGNQRFYVGYQVTPRDSSRNLCFTPLSWFCCGHLPLERQEVTSLVAPPCCEVRCASAEGLVIILLFTRRYTHC